MTRNSSFIRSLGVAATLAAVTFCSLNARAEVVFGNLGSSGTNQYLNSSTDLKPGSWLAQGFNTGTTSTNLSVSSITLGLFGVSEGTVPFSVAIYSNDSFNGNVPGTLLHTSAITNVGGAANYAFTFTGAELTANTSYWIVPSGGSSSSWYSRTGGTAPSRTPTGQNLSGYSYVGTAGSVAPTSSPSGPWSQEADNIGTDAYTVSITAVPEPSNVVMAGLGVGGLAMMVRTRRRKAASLRG